MIDKEQIIIDGRKRDCKILFRCKHIDDTAAYDMMCEGIEITPENAPVSDFELMLIENTNSPFGFSFVCKRNNKENVWEQSGFGNSGACSIVTALLKQLTCKTQECESLKDNFDTATRDCDELIEELRQECKELKKDIEERRLASLQMRESLCQEVIQKLRLLEALEAIEKECCAVLNGDEKILYAYQIKEIINKAKGTINETQKTTS